MPYRFDLIKVILKKELLDLLRDRRTVFMMVVLPILLYPLLLIIVMQVTAFQVGRLEEKTSRIVVLNGESAPRIMDEIQACPVLEIVDSLNWRAQIREGELDAAIEFSTGFEETILEATETQVTVYFNSSRDFSRLTKKRLEEPLSAYRDEIIEQRIIALDADPAMLEPFTQAEENLASDEQQQGTMVGRILGYLLVFMVLTGAFYAAIDLTAGEKERGTLETLLVSPVGRMEIVYGKFLATVTASALTASLNLISMGLTAVYALQMLGKGISGLGSIAISPLSLFFVFLIVIPLAVLFSGICLSIAVTARNYKEGQSALTPVMTAVILPVMVVFLPGVEINPTIALIPISNVVLLTVEFMSGNYPLLETLITLLSTSIFALLSIWWLTNQFNQESVLFRHADDIKWSLFSRRPAATATPLPSSATALLTAMILLIALSLIGSFTQDWGIIRALLTSQAIIILPVIWILYRGNHDVKRSLALRLPRPMVWPAAFIIALSGWLVTVELAALQHTMLPFPEDLLEQFTELFDTLNTMPLAYALLLLAVLPGICEELLCRGFMLRAFRPRLGTTGAIVIVSIIFGLLHMNPYRLLPTIVIGVLLALLSIWSGSIYPAMLGHFMNNALSFLVHKNEAWFSEIEWLSSSESDLLPLGVVII
ncbi:ABC transporter permease, partial [bacterium]|nr:ABC transporter permease [bacterium]